MSQERTNQPPPTPPRPYDAIMLSVGDGHWIYVEEVGRRDGIPAIFLHGGPARVRSTATAFSSILIASARSFSINVAQAAATPISRRVRTPPKPSIADIEKIREHLGIERWLVVGGSWGSTLALAYAQTHPERVTA